MIEKMKVQRLKVVTKKHILIIDDDQELAELLSDYLINEGFKISYCCDGISGLEKAYDKDLDLILLDVMMPGLNGFEVLKALGGKHKTPILMLTAKGDDNDRVLGLELGADDYLAKPFHHKELIARINAIFRRIDIVLSAPLSTDKHTVNQIRLNHATREAFCQDNLLNLTGTEYQILHFLISNHGQIVSKELLSEQVFDRKLTLYDRSIDMHVSNIRRKILSVTNEEKLKTIRGAGYLFLSGDD